MRVHIAKLTAYQGKSSLTVRLCEDRFVDSYYPTIENTFSALIKHKGSSFATEIVDTAGTVSLAPTPMPTRLSAAIVLDLMRLRFV